MIDLCVCGHGRGSHAWRLHPCATCRRQVERGKRDHANACDKFRRPDDALAPDEITEAAIVVHFHARLNERNARRWPDLADHCNKSAALLRRALVKLLAMSHDDESTVNAIVAEWDKRSDEDEARRS